MPTLTEGREDGFDVGRINADTRIRYADFDFA